MVAAMRISPSCRKNAGNSGQDEFYLLPKFPLQFHGQHCARTGRLASQAHAQQEEPSADSECNANFHGSCSPHITATHSGLPVRTFLQFHSPLYRLSSAISPSVLLAFVSIKTRIREPQICSLPVPCIMSYTTTSVQAQEVEESQHIKDEKMTPILYKCIFFFYQN